MKKLLTFFLALLLCVPAFADEPENPEAAATAEIAEGELFSYIGRPFDELYADIGGELDQYYFEDGITVYLHWLVVTARYTYDDADEKYGWDDDTVFYISLSDAGYSLNGVTVGDSEETVRGICEADGWTALAEAPEYCDFGYEKTVDGVKYTLGAIVEHGEDYINLVCIQGERLDVVPEAE